MSKGIQTYDDLVAYNKNLQQLLYAQKQLIVYDIEEIKEKVRPVTEAAAHATRLFLPSGDQSLLTKVISSGIDLLMKNVIMKRSGWLTRTIIPFIVHNISSHLVSDNKESILKKIAAWFSKTGKKNHEK
jgi:hypothetical protein